MAVIMEVADQRHLVAAHAQAVADVGDRLGGVMGVDRDPDDLRAGIRQLHHLARRRVDVGGVGVGHRLHDDRSAAADRDGANLHGVALMPADLA